MAETTRVWVRTNVLDEVVHGKSAGRSKRAVPDPNNPTSPADLDWGWARAAVTSDATADDGPLVVCVEDSECSHDRATVSLPADRVADGVLPTNVYGDGREDDDDHHDDGPCRYPDDLITLTHLHEPAVVYSIRRRYQLDRIYTATGPILLALNPFKSIGPIYGDQMIAKYRAAGETRAAAEANGGGEEAAADLPPHVFKVADNAYRVMMRKMAEVGGGGRRSRPKEGENNGVDQSILVSGESGAGKTWSTKLIMKYLAQLSQKNIAAEGEKSKNDDQSIEKQVLNSNPILESFGNARTIRNDNSSRFGKFIELQFSTTGGLVGARVDTYLLEKVRLVHQMPSERNYHIFYELLAGLDDARLERYHVAGKYAEDFRMISMSGTYDRRDGVTDDETFADLTNAMKVMNFSEEEVDDVFRLTACCLHATNLDACAVTADESRIDEDNEHLAPVLDLMGVDYDGLNQALCYFSIKAGRETHVRSLPKHKAEKGIQGLVKAVYGALFTFLVRRVNSSITVKDEGGGDKASLRRSVNGKAASIGVLDIFGFESFKTNSFEQLCINYCNETLQQQFNLFVLKNEQDEYEREGIQWTFISFPENQDVLDLIGKRNTGIISILDGQCRAPGTSDKTFANDLYKNCTKHPRFEANFRQVGALKFGLVHYAGPVEYDIEGFLEKNKDELPKETSDLLAKSTNALVRTVGGVLRGDGGAEAPKPTSTPRRGKAPTRQTVGGQFSAQLADLRRKIDATAPHYVRCLKPNDQLVPDFYNPVIVADQLRCAGVVEAVRVSRKGYPQRYAHAAFVNRYKMLAAEELRKAARSSKERPVAVLANRVAASVRRHEAEASGEEEEEKKEDDSLIAAGLQVGKTKVFLRQRAFDVLERLRGQRMTEAAVVVQAWARRYAATRYYEAALRAVVKIQSKARSNICKDVVEGMRRNHNAAVIQKYWRRTAARSAYANTRAMAKWIARVQRGRVGRARYERLNRVRKAIVVQKYQRRYVAYRTHEARKKAAAVLQRATRCHQARKVLRRLQEHARNLAAMSGERDQLRKENADLRSKLEIAELRAAAALETAASAGATKEETEALTRERDEHRDDAERLRGELEEKGEALTKETRRADEAAREVEERTEERDVARAATEELRETLEETKRTSAEAAAVAEERLSRATAESETARREAEASATRVLETVEEVERVRATLEETQRAAEEAAASALANLEAARQEAEAALREANDRHEDELAALTREKESREEELTALTREKDELRRELDEAKKELDDLEATVPVEELESAMDEIEALKTQVKNTEVRVREEARAEVEKEANERAEEARRTAKEELAAAERRATEALDRATRAEEDARNAAERAEKEARNAAARAEEDARNAAARNDEAAATEKASRRVEAAEKDRDEALRRAEAAEKDRDEALRRAEAAEKDANANAAAVFSMSAAPARTLDEDENTAFTPPPARTVQVEVPSAEAASSEIVRLRQTVSRLERDLSQARSAAPPNPMDPSFMMRQYEELKKFTDAMMDKDREISHLRHEINNLRERGDTEADSLDSSHYSSFSNFPGGGRSKYRSRDRDDGSSFAAAEVVAEQDEALQAVNQLLRKELEESRAEVRAVKQKLKEEKAKSEEDLKAFSQALRGVDELRQSAEIMSRELSRVKQKERRARARDRGFASSTRVADDDDDDATIATVATATLDEASRVLRSHQRQQTENPFWTKLRNFRETILDKVVEEERY